MFTDGELTGNNCPKCSAHLIFEMSFEDCWSYGRNEGHYTRDKPIIVCSNENCNYWDDYEYCGVEE